MTQLRATPLLIATVILATGCSTLQAQRDPWCRQLAAYANTAQVDAPRSIELVTDWSRWSKRCEDDGSDAGKQFCHWLIPNTSTEFASANIRHTLACLDPTAIHAGRLRSTPVYITGKVEVYGAPMINEDVMVTVEYADGIEGQLPHMKIQAERTPLDD
ncbi:hypothetical protein C1925_17435 [Stenotrophomonas sp. SAU14A_NAIMI4_5]|uniref:hypothetical protein n=1 Tax=Stenotrophomonas sp. SAU14A_NAIMI4_5 TaxID=2072413 RepID=UPI000D53D6EE|nr:hypothetical protein [Stenotrophomonas sp. SAU14A_NAIMI4_5]AWH50816.1 hypothetical protein C1925_17435 [Stenotrophomonas sp. SAU14A_NAIMI4_5]